MAYNEILVEDEKCIDYIQHNLSQTAILLQLSEECNEVAQVALKIVRICQKENPTPVTLMEARQKLHEELADFYCCFDSLTGIDLDTIEKIETEKLNRWCVRLAKRGKL